MYLLSKGIHAFKSHSAETTENMQVLMLLYISLRRYIGLQPKIIFYISTY